MSLLSLDYNIALLRFYAFLTANNIGPLEHCSGSRREDEVEAEEEQKKKMKSFDSTKNPVNIFMIGDSIDRNMCAETLWEVRSSKAGWTYNTISGITLPSAV